MFGVKMGQFIFESIKSIFTGNETSSTGKTEEVKNKNAQEIENAKTDENTQVEAKFEEEKAEVKENKQTEEKKEMPIWKKILSSLVIGVRGWFVD
ncbi:MAG: hypothetical protein E7Z91_05135 [Cyanobacteria bacterium SIG30]|nr:hypothetical protein [Cyanobacteria bacterium SIG30]